jgi:hypothetical protein
MTLGFELGFQVKATECWLAGGGTGAVTGVVGGGVPVGVPADGVTVKVATLVIVASAELVAVTLIVVAIDTLGAVNKPEVVTVPAVVDQVTAALGELLMVAVNCCFAPDTSFAVNGEVSTLPAWAGWAAVPDLAAGIEPPPQPVSTNVMIEMSTANRRLLRCVTRK